MTNKNRWYRLDSLGMVYPMVITPKTQSLYRLGVRLKKDVNPNCLKIAVNTALERYPFFKVELKHGFFRHYLDENIRTPLIEEDDGVLLKILNFRHNRYYLFRATYYKNNINIDFFHGLCDATGGMEFLKTVLYYYMKAADTPIPGEGIRTLSDEAAPEESEDAYEKYYGKFDFIEGLKKMAAGSAFRLGGRQFSYEGFGLIQIEAPTERLLEAAHGHDCSLTVYIAALAMLAVAKCYENAKHRKNYIAFIPVNLRKFYPSDTLFNFTNFAKCPIPKDAPEDLECFVKYIKTALKEQLTDKELRLKLSFTSLMDKFPPLRYMPLFLKGFLSRVGRGLSLKAKQTMIISNLGNIEIKGAEEVVDNLLFNLNCSERSPVNMGLVSYNGKTEIFFTRKLIETRIEERFVKLLTEECGGVKVAGNFREESDVL